MSQSQGDDKELLKRFAGGDNHAFVVFYAKYKDSLWRYLRGMLGDHDLAAETMQEIFAGLCRNLDGIIRAENTGSYLFGSAHKAALMKMRTLGREKKALKQLAEGAKRKTPHPERHSAGAGLEKALAGMTADDRELILLHVHEGFTFKELEYIRGESQNRIYRKYQKALEHLKLALLENKEKN